ncbi:unnamed protein product, partial [Effrenium voratum]
MEPHPLLTVPGAARDEEGRLDASQYHQLVASFRQSEGEKALRAELHFDPSKPGLRLGEELPSGLRTWDDAKVKSAKGALKKGAGWIATAPDAKSRWFNVRTWGSWRLAFLLAQLQRLLWESPAPGPDPPPLPAPEAEAKKRRKGKAPAPAEAAPAPAAAPQAPAEAAAEAPGGASVRRWRVKTAAKAAAKGGAEAAAPSPPELAPLVAPAQAAAAAQASPAQAPAPAAQSQAAAPAQGVKRPAEPKKDREKKPLWRQCLDRSGGIGKGQVRGFVQLMRSDLDLATKNGFMEALRLTISPKRLLRFVKHGGVTRVVLWLERALGESSSPELETFLENSLKSLRMLNLRAMDQSSAQSLVELIQRLRQRLQVGRKGADSAAKAAVPAAPRTPPQAAPRTPPKRNTGPPPRNRAPVIRVDRAEREPRATGELKPPASPVSAAAVPFAPPLGAQPKTPPLRWTEPKDAKPLLFGEKSPKALLFQAPAFKAAPGEKAEVQKVLFQAPASKAPPEGRAEVQKVSSVIALDEAVATPVHRSHSAIQAVPRARPSCLVRPSARPEAPAAPASPKSRPSNAPHLVLLAQPSTPELDANPVSPETEPKVQEKPSPELPQQPPVPKLVTSASPKAKPPAKDGDAKVPAAFRGKEKARVPAAFRAKEKARLWAEESLRVATPKAATSAAASVDAAFVDADAGAELPVKFERKRPAPRVVPPPRRKWARLAPEATEEPISHPETEDALQEEWWHQQQQQVAAEFLFAAVPEEEMDLAAPVEPQEWSFQEDLGLDKSDEEMVKQDHEEAENEEMAEAPEESLGCIDFESHT